MAINLLMLIGIGVIFIGLIIASIAAVIHCMNKDD